MNKKGINIRNEVKGITLIALVVTIVVLLILAGVSISMLVGENGLIIKASEASEGTKKANAEEQVQIAVTGSIGTDGKINNSDLKTNLDNIKNISGVPEDKIEDSDFPLTVTVDGYEVTINKNGEIHKTVASTIEEAKKDNVVFSKNTQITDEYGNSIKIPAGFKITNDSGNTVNEGIVIEDVSNGGEGNQFVWIPVGEVYTDVERSEENKKIIELKRYSFSNDGAFSEFVYSSSNINTSFYEYENDTDTSLYNNAIAKDLKDFKEKAVQNHGYYIGRYEVGITGNYELNTNNTNKEGNWSGYTGGIAVVQKNKQVYNYVTQKKASEISKNMYQNKSFESDLMNSYAFDTAIVFIQTCSTDKFAEKYSVQSGQASSYLVKNTGTAQLYYNDGKEDKQCNIYDLAGNCVEWLTSTYSNLEYPNTFKGGTAHGYYISGTPDMVFNANKYYSWSIFVANEDISFRTILYL